MGDIVRIFDTTLRDGEQSPGASMEPTQKLQLARQLARLKVDIIEAGFPISSPGDLESVRTIAQEVEGPIICGLARARPEDIEAAWQGVQQAARRRIHTFIGTSDVHIQHQLRKTPAEVLQIAADMVRLARERCEDVEFSPMDATRTEFGYLSEVVAATVEAGATTINIPDTVGYTMPWEMEELIRRLIAEVPGARGVIFSVHCHNDLGLATANSLAAVRGGARQVECAVNGLGERAGNASLEELVMGLQTRTDLMGVSTGVATQEIMRTSRMVSNFSGFVVAPNKAIVGDNAFTHESGIHADGVIKERTTFEIMDPEDVGVTGSAITLGPRSGRAALRKRLADLGYDVDGEELKRIYEAFLRLADRKKQVQDEDLETLIPTNGPKATGAFRFVSLRVTAGVESPVAEVCLERDGERLRDAAGGNGPVDAACKAIKRVTGMECTLEDFGLHGVTRGLDALGQARVRVVHGEDEAIGRAADPDIVTASAKAFLNAVNKLVVMEREGATQRPDA